MALSASEHNPTVETETASARESFEFYDPRGLFSKARRKPSLAVPSTSSTATSPNSERQRAAAGKSGEAAREHDEIRDDGHSKETVQDGMTANESAPTETAPIPILPSSASGHHLHQQHDQQPAYIYGHDGLPVHNHNIDERGRLSRLNINDDPTPRDSHSSSRRRPSDALASRLLSTSAGSRSRSRSRSASSTEEGRMSEDDNASSILSPAAEFLGSFTSSGTGSGLLGRSTTNAAAKARARANSRSTQQRDRAFSSSSSNIANNQKASRHFSISSVSHHPSFIAPDPDDEGEEVDGYILLEILGTGTFSTVRKARHLESGIEVAVKIVRHAAFQDQGRNEGGLGMGMGMSASTSGIGLWSRERDRKNSGVEGLRIASGVTVNGEASSSSTSSSTNNSRLRTANTRQQQQQASLGYLEVDDIPLRHRSCSSPSITMQLPTFFNHNNQGKSPSQHIDGLPQMEDEKGILEEDMDGDTPMQGLSPLPIDESTSIPGAGNDEEEGEADDMLLDEGLSFADAALQKEVYIWSQLSDHPHIVPLLHFHETDFASFIFMPLCGGNLLQYVRLNGKGNTAIRDGIQNSPPMPMIGSNSTTSLHRSVSITSNASTSSSAGHNTNTAGGGGGGKIGRSGSIRLRHPGEVVSGGMGLPFSTVQRIFSQIVLGLEYLHLQAKVTHKDIKLENILLDEVNPSGEGGGREGNENFRISDFGLAHAVEIMSTASSAGGEPGYISPPWRKGGRFDPRARREHALSDGDAQDIMMSSAPPHAIHFPSLGEAASLILPSSTRDSVPTAGPAAGASAPSMSLPDESLLELRHGSASQASPHKALKRTATTTSSSPPHASSSLSPPTARFKPTRSSLASRRSHIHAIPATLAQLSTTFGDATAGSLQYTSPEQIRSPAPITDYSVDIWALGCVLYAMIEGKLPFDDGFEPRLRVQIMKGEWKTPTALIVQDGELDEVKKEKGQITDILNGCLEMDAKKRWTIEQVANSEWLLEYMANLESPRSPSLSSRGRGRRPADSTHRSRQLDVQNEEGDEEDELHMRSRSRGRRPAMLRRESSQQPGGRTSSSRSGSGSSKRRGPSVDEYRRARGETPTRNSPRSRSAGRRYNGDSLTSWEIL